MAGPGIALVSGKTPRNAVMFGPAGHLYVYRSYGMHFCMNVSYGPVGTAGGVLLRAGEILDGAETVRARRSRVTRPADFARGPGNLGSATGVTLADNGAPLFAADSPIRLEITESEGWVSGPRVGSARPLTGRGVSGFPSPLPCRPIGEARVRCPSTSGWDDRSRD